MFKLVIVEDEDNIRHSLECFIPWEEIGFQVVNTFSDGSDALAYLKDNPCDAVLTDILMSRMSGLDMIQKLHTVCPGIKVVILSGHSNFAYAQQAITYKVTQYLVKPVDEEELISVFKGIKEQLDYEREDMLTAASETLELKQMLQKSFFRDLLLGRVISEHELNKHIRLLGNGKIKKDSQLLAFEIKADRYDREEPLLDADGFSLEDAFAKQMADTGEEHCAYLLEEKDDRWHVVFVGQSRLEKEPMKALCYQKMQMFIDMLNGNLPWEYTFHLTHSVTQISDFLIGAKANSDADNLASEQQGDESLCQIVGSNYKLLIVELDLGSWDTVTHVLKGLVCDLKDAPLEEVRFILKSLYSVIELNYKKRKINLSDITGGKFNIHRLYQAQNLEEIENCLLEDFSDLCYGLKNRKQENEHAVIGRVVQYLNEHVTEDIGHDVIATKYRIHPGYLSRLFKQEMGETLSEYLLRIKIERAAALLKQGEYKIGEIAAMVGYGTPSYFSIIFKKLTGHSPREYSQRISL